MFTEVLVPFDGSEDSQLALEVGAGLAAAASTELRILAHRKDPDDSILSVELCEKAFDVGRRYGLRPHLTALEPKRFLSDAIVSEARARPGSVICMRSHGRGRMAVFTGSLTADILLYGPGPAVLVGPDCVGMVPENGGPILAAVDGSHASETVLRVADAWAFELGLPLEIVEVVPTTPDPAIAGALADGDIFESGYLANLVRDHSELRNHGASYDVLHGKPAEAILGEAKARNASLIAMASHVPLGFERLRRGSVTDDVVRHSRVPVLAMHSVPLVEPDVSIDGEESDEDSELPYQVQLMWM